MGSGNPAHPSEAKKSTRKQAEPCINCHGIDKTAPVDNSGWQFLRRQDVAETDEERPRRKLWMALLSGVLTGYIALMGLILFFR